MEEIGTNVIKVLSLFSGIGAFERALENLNIPHKIVAYVVPVLEGIFKEVYKDEINR